jgi:hypothetical protein
MFKPSHSLPRRRCKVTWPDNHHQSKMRRDPRPNAAAEVGFKEVIMVELSKSAKIRVLVVGLLLVKLALLLFFYHPVLGRASLPASMPPEATQLHLSGFQAPETPAELQRTAVGQPQVETTSAEPGRAENSPGETPWEAVKQLAARRSSNAPPWPSRKFSYASGKSSWRCSKHLSAIS